MTDNEFSDYWAFLVERKHSGKSELSCDERIFYAANVFRGSVPRSGLVGYFENTQADVIRDAHHALATLGLSEVLKHLQDAQEIVLKGHPLPETDECVSLFNYDLPEEELEKAMDELNEAVGCIQDQLCRHDLVIFDSLCRFADERRLATPKG